MTDSRNSIEQGSQESKQNQEQDSKVAQVGREALKIGLIGGGVAGIMLGPNMALQSLQTMNCTKSSAKSTSNSLLQKGGLFACARTIVRGYTSAAKASTIKGGLIAEREHVDGLIEKNVSEKEGTHTLESSSLGRMALVSGFLGGADTVFTQRARNFQTWNFHATMHPGYPVPAPVTFSQHLAASMIGFRLRCAANVISLAGFLAITPIKDTMGNILPVYSYADFNNVVATAASAFIVGPITNALAGVWYTNYVLSFNAVTFKPRKMMDVAKDLIAMEGKTAMFKGVKTSVLVTGLTFGAVNIMEGVANKVVPVIASGFIYCADRLFKPDVSKNKLTTPAVSPAPTTTSQENDEVRCFVSC